MFGSKLDNNQKIAENSPLDSRSDELSISDSPSSSGDSFSFAEVLRSAKPNFQYANASLSGQVLAAGRIRVGARIGGGAMGTVYDAVHDGLPVAIKVLNRVQEHDVYRLKTEFRTLREMHHPNVVKVYELFNEGQTWFFTMERVDGLPIHRYLEQQRLATVDDESDTSSLNDLRAAFYQLVKGTAAIHACGLTHRDLKPTNVLVAKGGRVVVIDFGLVTEQLPGGIGQTIDNRVSGTFGYMSPEQARGAQVTAASDCFALGAILRQLLISEKIALSTSNLDGTEVDHHKVSEELAVIQTYFDLCDRLESVAPQHRLSASELLVLLKDWETQDRVAYPSDAPTEALCPFGGRESELEFLRRACRASKSGGPPVTLVYGECGIGKSLLIRTFLDELTSDGTIALTGKCSEWESVPYRGLDGVMDRLARVLLRISVDEVRYLVPRHTAAVLRIFPVLRRVPVLREASESAQCESDEPFLVRRRALSGLKDLFFRLAERRRVVVTIEDLQWADTDTLQILSELLTPPEKPDLFVLLSARTEAELIRTIATGLRKVAAVELLEIGPLNAEASRVLADNLLPTSLRTEPILQRIVEESHGIPEQIVAFAQELSIAPKGREPALLCDALMARIERLDPKSRALLELIAVAVRPITVPIAAGCGLSGIQDSIRDLMQQHLVRSASLTNGERGFDIYNDHVRKVALHAIPEERSASYHRRLISVLENSSKVEPEWLLAHYRGAGAYDRAKEYSVIIAQKALQLLAYDHAASMFLVALELTSEHSADWSALNISCAEALTKAGRGVEAASAYVRAARGLSRDEQLPLLSLAVEQWIRSGHVERGVELLRQTLKWVGLEWPETTASALFQLVSRRITIRLRGLSCEPRLEADAPVALLRKLDAIRPAQTVLGTYDYIRGATFAAMALPLALKAREPKRLLIALASEAIFAAMLDGANGAGRVKDVLEKVNELYHYAERPIERAIPAFVKAVTSYWMGNWSQVPEHSSHAETILRERVEGTLWEASLARSVRHTVMLHNGNVVGLTDELPDALSQATMYDDRYTQLDLQRRVAAVHLLNDHVAEAKKVIETICEERNRSGIIAMDHLIMSLVVAVLLYEGDVVSARFELEKRWAECTKIGMHRFPQVRLSVIGMYADCNAADTKMTTNDRRNEFLKLEKLARNVPVTWSRALSSMLAGEAFECEGKTHKSIVEFMHASEGFSESGFSVCSIVASKRAEQLQRVNRTTERDILGFVRNPERWMKIARTLY